MQYLVDLVSKRLYLNTTTSDTNQRRRILDTNQRRRILDIGGGTGNFAKELVSNSQHTNNLHITVVEPFLEETNSNDYFTVSDRVSFVKAPAQEFLAPPNVGDAWRKTKFQQILIKETIHHLDEKDRVGIFRGMYNELEPFGDKAGTVPSLLIITRPQIYIDYPLWDAARSVWKRNQPSADEIVKELQLAGFVDVHCTIERYDSQIEFTKWCLMVKNRFWSTFANFTDEELEDGCKKLAEERPPDENGVIHFEARLVFISARKVE